MFLFNPPTTRIGGFSTARTTAVLAFFILFNNNILTAKRTTSDTTTTTTTSVEKDVDQHSGSFNREEEEEEELDEFYRLRINDTYVDKSLFVEAYLNATYKTVFISRPIGWGKTVLLRMLKTFLEIPIDENGHPIPKDRSRNRKLFFGGRIDNDVTLEPLKIATSSVNGTTSAAALDSQGEIPIIYVSFANVLGRNYDEIESQLKRYIIRLFRRHDYLLLKLKDDRLRIYNTYRNGNITRDQLENSLAVLAELIGEYFQKKPYILIDDYDATVNYLYASLLKTEQQAIADDKTKVTAAATSGNVKAAFERAAKSKELTETFLLYRGIYYQVSTSIEHQNATEKVLIVGVQSSLLITGDPCDISEYSVRDFKYAEYFGFTEEEVDNLLLRRDNKNKLDINRKDLSEWYGGHYFGQILLHNPTSIVRCLNNNGCLEIYRTTAAGSSSDRLLHRLWIDTILQLDEVQEYVLNLLDEPSPPKSGGGGNNVTVDGLMTRKIMWHSVYDYGLISAVLFHGYLNTAIVAGNDTLALPNREVRDELKIKLSTWMWNKSKYMRQQQDDIGGPTFKRLLLSEDDAEKRAENVRALLKQATSKKRGARNKDKKNYYRAVEKCLKYASRNDTVMLDALSRIIVKE